MEGQAGVPADRRRRYCRYTCRYKVQGKVQGSTQVHWKVQQVQGKYTRYQEGTKVRKYGSYGMYGKSGKSGKVRCTEKHPAVEQEELEDQLGGTWRPRRGPSLQEKASKEKVRANRA